MAGQSDHSPQVNPGNSGSNERRLHAASHARRDIFKDNSQGIAQQGPPTMIVNRSKSKSYTTASYPLYPSSGEEIHVIGERLNAGRSVEDSQNAAAEFPLLVDRTTTVSEEQSNPDPDVDLALKEEDSQDELAEISSGEEFYANLSDLDISRIRDTDYLENRRWRKNVMKEVAHAFKSSPDIPVDPGEEVVEVEHTFDFDAQVRMQAQKRRGEDCGIVFCTVDMSPSWDAFTQWVYQEEENKAAMQATHIKVIAPRHYPLT
ncbi:hypothetical protein R1sor_008174 [Riccia sorocarpa]|uniref:Uncharacterized protein n=1 Tax=Riccia sorocarpa TaxID=122646 RepID=A0ABD3HSZ8_9MARC